MSVSTGMIRSPTMRASRRIFHRDGCVTGHVGILGVFLTATYSGSYSPGDARLHRQTFIFVNGNYAHLRQNFPRPRRLAEYSVVKQRQ